MRRILQAGILLALPLCAAAPALAVPTLYFDGGLSFNSTSNILSVNTTLTGAVDVVPAPTLAGSSLIFSAQLNPGSVSSSGGVTGAGFDSAPGSPDFSVTGGLGGVLLQGEFVSLFMRGTEPLYLPGITDPLTSGTSGILSGVVQLTGGSLTGQFAGLPDVFALELNLTTAFGPAMFASDFDGLIDGKMTAAPEPPVWLLMWAGLLALVAVRRPAPIRSSACGGSPGLTGTVRRAATSKIL